MKSVERSRPSQRLVGKVTVGGSINRQDKSREVHQDPSFRSSDEATTPLFEMSSKAVERNHETRNMEGISDENLLILQGEDGSATANNREKGIVAHPNLEILNGFV
jgi:hypothetical protein